MALWWPWLWWWSPLPWMAYFAPFTYPLPWAPPEYEEMVLELLEKQLEAELELIRKRLRELRGAKAPTTYGEGSEETPATGV